MGRRLLAGVVAVATVILASPGFAGGGGGFHGGGIWRPAGHSPIGGPRGYGGGTWRGGMRPMPPVAGVIHERSGMRPYYSSYGHTRTGFVPGRDAWHSGFRTDGPGGFGHVATGFQGHGLWHDGRAGYPGRWERDRFADGRRVSIYRFGRDIRRTAGYGGGVYLGGGGGYDGAVPDAGAGGYGTPGTYGAPGTYGSPGTYGHYGTQTGDGGAYLSEPPLAATRAEAPLAPSPYGADGGYYAPHRSSAASHILTVDRSYDEGCGCRGTGSSYPVIYKYGVGTAY